MHNNISCLLLKKAFLCGAVLALICGAVFAFCACTITTPIDPPVAPSPPQPDISSQISPDSSDNKNSNNTLTDGSELVDDKDKITEKDFPLLISNFSTSFSTSSEARRHNIAIAASRLNDIVLGAGQTLSFNKIVGNRTSENGFLSAKIIMRGEFSYGIGGGVCQVSTTLFGCWLYAGLEVEHSQNHSLPVSYVPRGQDAMVSFYNDLCLKNNLPVSVKLKAKIVNDVLTFSVISQSFSDTGCVVTKDGTVKKFTRVAMSSELIKTYLPDPLYTNIGTGQNIAYVQDYTEGKAYRLFANYYNNDDLIEKRAIRDSYYIAKTGKIFYSEKPTTS